MQYCKFFKQFVFVKFEGLDDINDVEKYKRCPLKVTRENAVPLEEDEYYVADLPEEVHDLHRMFLLRTRHSHQSL